jgi:uncharacterized protein YndB with AHSA1/START domain
MSEDAPAFTPIRKSVFVKAPPDRAFRRFTAELGRWWPRASHSIGGADSEAVLMEERVGGRIRESIGGGREAVWGTVTAWEPPHRVAFTWHPGHDPAQAQDVEVTFVAVDEGTRVELTHTGFERLGAQGRMARRAYPMGWVYVLGLYAERGGPVMWLLTALTGTMTAGQRLRAWFRPKATTIA